MIQSGTVMLKNPLELPGKKDMNNQFSHAIKLIGKAQSLRAKGSISEGLKELEKALSTPELNQEFED